MTSLLITITGMNMTLDPRQPVAIITYRAAVADSASTFITVSNPMLNGSDPMYSLCILSAAGNSTEFMLTSACGDSNLRSLLNGRMPISIESIHPNPATEHSVIVDIRSESGDVVNLTLFDVLGRKVKSQDFSPSQSNAGWMTDHPCQLDLTGVVAGSYVVRAVSGSGAVVSGRINVK